MYYFFYIQGKPLTAMTWGHCDKRLFLAAGCYLYIACVSKHVSSLQFLCQQVVHQRLHSAKAVHSLPLPQTLQGGVKALFSPTLKVCNEACARTLLSSIL